MSCTYRGKGIAASLSESVAFFRINESMLYLHFRRLEVALHGTVEPVLERFQLHFAPFFIYPTRHSVWYDDYGRKARRIPRLPRFSLEPDEAESTSHTQTLYAAEQHGRSPAKLWRPMGVVLITRGVSNWASPTTRKTPPNAWILVWYARICLVISMSYRHCSWFDCTIAQPPV